jgi:hypothetical protein
MAEHLRHLDGTIMLRLAIDALARQNRPYALNSRTRV